MTKKFMVLLAMLVAATIVFRPSEGQALTQIQKIDQELEALKKEMERAQVSQREAENRVKSLSGEKAATEADILALNQEIAVARDELKNLDQQIADAEEQLRLTGLELEEATKQRDLREELKDNRVRMAYMAGPASFLEVLMESTNVSDFLTRLDTVEAIMKQDNDIVQQAQHYKEQVELKQKQLDDEFEALKLLYADQQKKIAELEAKEQEKEAAIATLEHEIEENEGISEEAQAQLKEFAKKSAELQAKKKALTQYYKGGALGMPLQDAYRVSSEFGYRIHPIYKTKRLHAGIDLAAPKGTTIYAAESGRVITAQWMSGYGNCVIIDHGGGIWTVYGHIMNGGILVSEGDEVKRGQKIAQVGSTGDSTGNHLHFEVRKDSEPVNPRNYVKF